MIKNTLIAVCLILSFLTARPQSTFQAVFGFGFMPDFQTIQQTTDEGYVLSVLDNAGQYANLIKTDPQGQVQWIKQFKNPSSAFTYGYSAQQTTDGGFILAGYEWDGLLQVANYTLLIKTDTAGDTLWTKRFSIPTCDFSNGFSVQQTTDGGYIITGNGCGMSLIKTDAAGDILWTKNYGGFNSELGRFVRQTTDGGYIVGGRTWNFSAGLSDIYVVKTDTVGDTLWTKVYGGSENEWLKEIHQTSDGGYIIGGYTESFGAGNEDLLLIKTDANGNVLWNKTYGGPERELGGSVQQTNSGGYILTGSTSSFGLTGAYAIKTDSNGDTLWTKSYGNANVSEGHTMCLTNDGGFIIAGYQQIDGLGLLDRCYLVKADSNGFSGCEEDGASAIVGNPSLVVSSTATIISNPPDSIAFGFTVYPLPSYYDSTVCGSWLGAKEISNHSASIKIHPNPTTGIFTVANATAEIQVFDLFGRLLLRSNEPEIDMSGYGKGIYLVRIGDAVRKLIVQ